MQVFYWRWRHDEISKKDFVCLIRSLWTQAGDYLGVLVVNLDPNVINEKLHESLFNTAIFVDHKIFYSAFNGFSVENVQELSKIEMKEEFSSNSIKRIKFNGQRYGIISEDL